MIYLLGMFLFTQLDHFGFDSISSPKTAGVPFQITIYALNSSGQPVPYNGSARLYIPNINYQVKPDTIIYFNGNSSWQGNIIVSLANDSIILKCEAGTITGSTNQFQVLPNAPVRLLSVLPGETYAPGSNNGRIGSPTSQQAGTYFTISIYLTDFLFNRIDSAEDSIRCMSSDIFSPIIDTSLISGNAIINYTFRTATTNRCIIADISNPQIRSDTSSSIYIYPGNYERLLMLLPGETHLPGDTTTHTENTPGKSGIVQEQYVLEDFEVKVYATDSMWNKTSVSGPVIKLFGSSGFSNPDSQNLQNGEATFYANFSSSGEKFIYARDLNNNYISYDNFLKVVARANDFDISVEPDTISPGKISYITATVYDRNNTPIGGKWVAFRVVGGNGYILAQYDSVQTNSEGVCQSQFTITSGYFNELDTIEVRADNYAESTTVYVIIPDSSVMEGNIVAYPNPFGRINQPFTRFIYYLQESCNIIYMIFDAFGNLVHREEITAGQQGARAGINVLTWNGRNDKGKRVATGVYYVLLKGYTHTNVFLEKRMRLGVIW